MKTGTEGKGGNWDAFDKARLRLHDELASRRLGEKCTRIVVYIREQSWDVKRTRAYIPKQAEIVRATGLYPADVSRGIKLLKKWLVIDELEVDGKPGGIYGINVLFFFWKAPLRKHGARPQDLFLEEAPMLDLAEALRQDFVQLGGSTPQAPTHVSNAEFRGGRPYDSDPPCSQGGATGGVIRESAGVMPRDEAHRAEGLITPPPPSEEAGGENVSETLTKGRPQPGELESVSVSLTTVVPARASRVKKGVVSETLTKTKSPPLTIPPKDDDDDVYVPLVEAVAGVYGQAGAEQWAYWRERWTADVRAWPELVRLVLAKFQAKTRGRNIANPGAYLRKCFENEQLFGSQAESDARPTTQAAEAPPVQPEPTFPKTLEEAQAAAAAVGCPVEFVAKVWHTAMGRGGRDGRDIPIRSWPHHLAGNWAYEVERKERRKIAAAEREKPAPKQLVENIQPKLLR